MPISDSVESVAIDNEGSVQSLHDITLQRLDVHTPYPKSSTGKLRYKVDNFAGTEQAWNDSAVVFVPPGVPIQHVDHAAFARDPQGEAARLGFKIVGHHADTKVISNGPGEPRIVTKAVIEDSEFGTLFNKLALEGKLSPSSGFDAVIPDNEIVGTVQPNHVLYFLRGQPTAFGTAAAPNDLGAYVNNLSENPVSDKKDETMELEELKDKILSIGKKVDNIADHTIPKPEDALLKAKTTIDNMVGEMKGKEAKIAELEAQIEALEKQVEVLKGDKAEADNLRAAIEQEKRDTRWAAVKNLYTPGMFHKPEVEQELRKKCEADPIGFQLENVNNLARAPVGAAKAQGVSTAKGSVDNMGNDQKIDVRDQIGKWSASEGKMVSIRGE